MLSSPTLALANNLDALENVQLVRRAADIELAYLFKNALTQETVYQSLLKLTRTDLHRRVAEVTEQLWPDRQDQNAAILATHYELAGIADKAFDYAVRAGDQAARAFASAEALLFYNRVLRYAIPSHEPDPDRDFIVQTRARQLHSVFVRKGRIFEVLGNHAAAADNYRAMIEFAGRIGDEAMESDALNRLVTVRVILSGATPETDAQLERALMLAQRAQDPELTARALWNRGLPYRFTDPRRSMADFEQALALADAANLRELAAHVRLDLGIVLELTGQSAEARANVEHALADFRALDLKPMVADALANMSFASFVRAEPQKARALAEEGRTISESVDNPWGVLYNQTYLIAYETQAGHLERGLADIERALPGARQIGYPYFVLICMSIAEWICLECNQPELAQSWADRASGAFDLASDQAALFEFWVQWLYGQVSLHHGDLERAHTQLEPAMQLKGFPLGPLDQYGWLGQSLIELALREKRLEDAFELCERLADGFERTEQKALAGGIYYWRAQVYQARGNIEQAERDAELACELLERAENRLLLWRAHALLAEIYAAQGNDAGAQTQRERARTTIQYIAAHTPAELRASFLASNAVRRAMAGA